MALGIEDYALIGDCHTAALIGRDGSIDWLCFPRFDSASTFGALLGDQDQGRWLLAPSDKVVSSSRRYVGDSFVLETTWETASGTATVTELMPLHDRSANVIRRVTGVTGTVTMRQELRIRFDYATAIPWMRRTRHYDADCLVAVAGPNAVILRGGPMPAPAGHAHVGEFTVEEGQQVDVVLTWFPSHRKLPPIVDVSACIDYTTDWWQKWAVRTQCEGPYAAHIRRSLLVLRALTDEDTGGIVAAATTSLPEWFGGIRNWDYRYCWLRDASLTLSALIAHGYKEEAQEWRLWLLRALAGDPEDVQIMYGVGGERDLMERELTSLPGYQGSAPVRIGNGAVDQYQADVLGEVMVALAEAREAGVDESEFSWPLQRSLLRFIERNWERADQGLWEIRGPERYFTHSRVMNWAALDRGIRAVEDHGFSGHLKRWKDLRSRLAQEIEEKGFDKERNTYTQYYGSTGVDASLLVLAQVGYVDYDDPRMLGTVAAIEKELLHDGLLLRYRSEDGVDGLPPGEHPFLACSFWLVEQYAHTGRLTDALRLMDRLLTFTNDLGLLSEEYDVKEERQVGNTPQAFSHLALVRAADAINAAFQHDDSAQPLAT